MVKRSNKSPAVSVFDHFVGLALKELTVTVYHFEAHTFKDLRSSLLYKFVVYILERNILWIFYGILYSYNTWVHAILFVAGNIASLLLPLLHVIPSFFSTFSVLIIFLKKVLNVSTIFVSSVTISYFSKSVIFELLDNFLSVNNRHIIFRKRSKMKVNLKSFF